MRMMISVPEVSHKCDERQDYCDGKADAESLEEPDGIDGRQPVRGRIGLGPARHRRFSISWQNLEDDVAEWVRLCGVNEVPKPGEVMETEVSGIGVCLANVEGRLAALDNWCPHRRGPLGQGWLEGEAIVCPWHSWAFSTVTGVAEPPERAKVDVFPVKVEGDALLVDIA